MQIKPSDALKKLKMTDRSFLELFNNGNVSIEVYKPIEIDLQQPHTRDELYVIIAGSGTFILENEVYAFSAGDLFFVPAGKAHRFQGFTANFSTWVVFFG